MPEIHASDAKNEYELAFLLAKEEALGDVLTLLKDSEAAISYKSQLNQIRLSYPVKKQSSAFFGYCQFSVVPASIKKISSDLALAQTILRFLITVPVIKAVASSQRLSPKSSESKPAQFSQAASNEALEQKLEEFLK